MSKIADARKITRAKITTFTVLLFIFASCELWLRIFVPHASKFEQNRMVQTTRNYELVRHV